MNPTAKTANGPLEILIAEDSPTQAQRLQHILEQQGYEVTATANGQLALEAAQRRKPTLIISDVIMPEMDGYELCRRLKADASLAEIPVILVTTLSDPHDVIRGLECRADNFILKPYDERYLLNRVQFVLVNREMRQSDQPGMGLEIFFNGQKHFITADRLQILNLLLSTYEVAMQRNKELGHAQDRLRQTNSELSQLTLELESRVAERTQELEWANEALRESEARTRLIIDTALDAVVTMDGAGLIRGWNAQAEAIFGWPPDETVGKPLAQLIIPPPQRDHHAKGLQHFLTSDEGPLLNRRIEVTALHRDGREFPIELSIAPMKHHGGWTFSGFARDITERKETERKLRLQLSQLDLLHQITRAIGERYDLSSIFQVVIRSLEDNLPIDFGCICLHDPAEKVVTVTSVGAQSGALAKELGMPEQTRIGIDEDGLSRCVRGQLVYEPDISQVPFPFSQRLAGGGLRALVAAPLLVESQVFGLLVAARRQDNSFSSSDCEFLRQLSGHVALAAHQAQIHVALQQAYNDLRQSQQVMLQQERLRALGQMASGVAHDINNAISPAALYTELLLERETNLSERARGFLGTIQRAIDDAAQTVSRMREFCRQREPQLALASVQFNSILEEVLGLTRARWSDMPQERGLVIYLQRDFADDLPGIMGVESEMRDALTNLVLNAVDAMPEGGKLTVGTRASPTHVYVEVCDTGLGMDEEARRRCLEPFFTTKGERGTGLGLAMVFGMVQRHHAEIEIESEPGQGTTVRLIFPLSAQVVAAPGGPTLAARPARRLRVLVVDDDPLIIKSVRDALEGDGHLVKAVDGGQLGIDAFAAAHERGEDFAVVITDLGMPYVDGRKVAAAVKSASPATPVILLTGWGQRLISEEDTPSHVDRVLSKPPKLHELRAAMAELTVSPAQTAATSLTAQGLPY